MLRTALLIALLVPFTYTYAEGRVADAKYQRLLNTILNDETPALSVTDVGDPSHFVFLDARSEAEYSVSRIRNAIRVGYLDFHKNKLAGISKDAPIVVYCSIGVRSEIIAARLRKLGYKKVYNLFGGIFEWVNRQRTVYNKHGVTNRIHGYNAYWSRWLKPGPDISGVASEM